MNLCAKQKPGHCVRKDTFKGLPLSLDWQPRFRRAGRADGGTTELDGLCVTVQPRRQRVDSSRDVPVSSTQRAFPYRSDAPAVIQQSLPYPGVVCAVAGDFCGPEFSTRSRQPEQRAVMPVPEAAMDEDDRTSSRKNDVGFSWQVPAVDAKPESPAVQQASDQLLGLRVAAANPGHHAATCGAVYDIDH